MGIVFVLGWWKHSGIKWWWYLHNSVNVLKTIELYTLNVWNSWHVYFSETVKMTVFLPLPIPCFYCIILYCSHLWFFSSDILLFANDNLKRQGLQPDPFCFLDSLDSVATFWMGMKTLIKTVSYSKSKIWQFWYI